MASLSISFVTWPSLAWPKYGVLQSQSKFPRGVRLAQARNRYVAGYSELNWSCVGEDVTWMPRM